MTDFDQFERRLADAIRSDADMSVGPFKAESIAREAIASAGPGATRLPRASSRPGGRFGRGRGLTLLAAATLVLVGGAAVGSGIVRLPSIVPPVPVPSFAVVTTASPSETTSPTPSASASPSPTPSLDLVWTQVPLDEQAPHLAWLGDRFVLVDAKSGSVRTSTDGQNWQALQPGDAGPGYVNLLQGSFATSQDSAVGWFNPQEGPDIGGDIAGAPPITARDMFTTVRPTARPFRQRPSKAGSSRSASDPKASSPRSTPTSTGTHGSPRSSVSGRTTIGPGT